MTPELEKRLYIEFPLLFRMRFLDNPNVGSSWQGIQCKDGWFDLIRNMSCQIAEYANHNHLDPVFTKIGKRLGKLRVDVDCDDDHIKRLCQQAMAASCNICEVCGETGDFSLEAPLDIKVCCPAHKIEDRPLTQDETEQLKTFNETLRKLEYEIAIEGRKQVESLSRRVAEPNDPLDDFEIEAVVSFYLHEGDPSYRDDEDNILTKRIIQIPKIPAKSDSPIDVTDWNDRPDNWGIPHHCWLFHELYDHEYGLGQQRLSIQDILRIGLIWIDIDIQVQMFRNGDERA